MRADRDDDTPYVHERPRGNYTITIVAASIALLAMLLYIGLSDEDEVPAPATQQVVRDSAVVAPPVVDAPAPQPQAAQNTTPGFSERRLAPPSSTVGAGTAPISESVNGERLVIDGELLEELEEDASEGAAADADD